MGEFVLVARTKRNIHQMQRSSD